MSQEQLLKKWFVVTALALTAMLAAAHDVGAMPQRTPVLATTVVGLPILASDGEEIGKVLATGTDEHGLGVLVAEIELSLELGSIAVAIPTDMFVLMTDHILLTINKAEVSERLADRRH